MTQKNGGTSSLRNNKHIIGAANSENRENEDMRPQTGETPPQAGYTQAYKTYWRETAGTHNEDQFLEAK